MTTVFILMAPTAFGIPARRGTLLARTTNEGPDHSSDYGTSCPKQTSCSRLSYIPASIRHLPVRQFAAFVRQSLATAVGHVGSFGEQTFYVIHADGFEEANMVGLGRGHHQHWVEDWTGTGLPVALLVSPQMFDESSVIIRGQPRLRKVRWKSPMQLRGLRGIEKFHLLATQNHVKLRGLLQFFDSACRRR